MALTVLSPQAYKDQILVVLGNSEVIQLNVDSFWAMHTLRYASDYAIYLHTQRSLIAIEFGNLEEEVKYPIEGDRGTQVNTRLSALRELRKMTDALIADLTDTYPPLAGVMTLTVPHPSPVWAFDAADPSYRGDPNAPGWGPT